MNEATTPPDWHPTGKVPALVDLVCLGQSMSSYVQERLTKESQQPIADETWTLNRGALVFKADVIFVLDDLEGELAEWPIYATALQKDPRPIITTKPLIQWPTSLAYPLAEVAQHIHPAPPYFHNSVPMILAYALALGVPSLRIWGADYTLGARVLEADRANAEYMVGFCRARGMTIEVPPTSSLMNANNPERRRWMYGYQNVPLAFATWHDAVTQGNAGPS